MDAVVLRAAVSIAGLIALIPGSASGQPNPTFTYGTPEEAAAVEWAASGEAGVLYTTGNSRTTTFTGSAKASRKAGNNKLEVEATGAFARSTVRIAVESNDDGVISADEIQEQDATSAKNALFKARYDRFLTEHNSLYVSAAAGFDEPAGKDLFGGGQVGYSRLLFKNDRHEAKAEVGYDFTYESLSAGGSTSIHSARGFVGYKGALRVETDDDGKVSTTTSAEASIEGLFNVNALDVPTGDGRASAFEDTRLIGIAGVTTQLFDDISMAVSFTVKFDNVPAPLAPFALPYAPGFVPEAEKLDTITKATLIVSFL